MTRKEMLRGRLEEAFRTSIHHSFLGSLKGVSQADALWRPACWRGFPHMDGSILSLAFHAGGDKHVLASCAFGDGSVGWDQVRARFQELGGTLEAARRLAEEGHARLLEELDRWPEEELDRPRPYYGGRTLAAAEVFALAAEHDLYHAGQVWYARNLIAGEKRA